MPHLEVNLSTTNTTKTSRSSKARLLRLLSLLPACALLSIPSAAQTSASGLPSTPVVEEALLTPADLPDAPGEPVDTSTSNQPVVQKPSPLRPRSRGVLTGHLDMVVLPDEVAAPLTARQKFFLGVKESVSPYELIGWAASAGFSQLRNSAPNYGTDSGAYGQRFGAAAARNASENIFGDALLAPLLHEDPRYYTLGPDHNPVKRGLYAITRVFITRTDGGRSTPNLSLLSGNLAAAALTNAYYPQINRSASQTFKTFGASLGGSAIGFSFSEFYVDALELIHMKKD